MIANLSTKQDTFGEVCIVQVGEHEGVSQKSFLRFEFVRVEDSAQLLRSLKVPGVQSTKSASPTLLAKLQEAVCESSAVPKEAKEILSAQGFC